MENQTQLAAQINPLLDEHGILRFTAKKKRRTPSEAKSDRQRACLQLMYSLVRDKGIQPEADEDYRAFYWEEKSGEGPHLWMFLVASPPLSARMRRAVNEGRRPRPERARLLGVVRNNILHLHRAKQWHYHRKHKGLTFSLHILLNAKKYGFESIEVQSADIKLKRDQKLVSVKELLLCPRLKATGGYEEQALLKTPERSRWLL